MVLTDEERERPLTNYRGRQAVHRSTLRKSEATKNEATGQADPPSTTPQTNSWSNCSRNTRKRASRDANNGTHKRETRY